MIDIADATNGVTFYNDYQFNSIKNNIIDLVESSGQTPITDTGVPDTNLQQVSIGMSIYAAGGQFYIDSGIANAYVLGVQTISGTPMRAPDVYFNGMTARFTATNTNTGISTANIAGLGIKTIKKENYTVDVSADDMTSGFMYDLVYSVSAGFLELKPVLSAGQLSIIGTQGDTIYKGATSWQNLPIGTAGQSFRVNSGATAPEWANVVTFVDTNVVTNQVIPTVWTNVDLSSVVGSNTALVTCRVSSLGSQADIAFRTDGETADVSTDSSSNEYGGGTTAATIDDGHISYIEIKTSSSGIIEIKREDQGSNYSLDVIAFIK